MIDTEIVEFKVTLDVGECNGFMQSQWYANDKLVASLNPTSTESIDLCFGLCLPGIVKIVLSGKDMNSDTLVDDSGKIVKDKFISIKQMSLARHPVPYHVYTELCKFSTEQGTSSSSYYGSPGTVTISFEQDDPIAWHMIHTMYKID